MQARTEDYAVSSWNGDYMLLARLVSGEARGEPFPGQVGVAAVILNRAKHPKFPPTVAGVIFQPGAFESVSNGQIWASYPSRSNFNAAREALNGWDPTYGSLYFWNPYKWVSPWVWTRRVMTQIGRHVFGK
ncbi:MAG: cell wall hydrolase [Tepidanaerobacteraceae bacterium]|nr:cell wall hydrolase [Tepidanaerobacteraceae bacterium]